MKRWRVSVSSTKGAPEYDLIEDNHGRQSLYFSDYPAEAV